MTPRKKKAEPTKVVNLTKTTRGRYLANTWEPKVLDAVASGSDYQRTVKVRGDQIYVTKNLDTYIGIDSMIVELTAWREQHTDGSLDIDSYSEYGSTYVSVELAGWRKMTDEEASAVAMQLAKQEVDAAQVAADRKAQEIAKAMALLKAEGIDV